MAFITFYRADDFSRIGLERAYAYFDRLHDVASEGHLREVSNMPPAEVIEYLHEVMYVLEETVREIREHEGRLDSYAGDRVSGTEQKEEV
jgi:hypothetical protein